MIRNCSAEKQNDRSRLSSTVLVLENFNKKTSALSAMFSCCLNLFHSKKQCSQSKNFFTDSILSFVYPRGLEVWKQFFDNIFILSDPATKHQSLHLLFCHYYKMKKQSYKNFDIVFNKFMSGYEITICKQRMIKKISTPPAATLALSWHGFNYKKNPSLLIICS